MQIDALRILSTPRPYQPCYHMRLSQVWMDEGVLVYCRECAESLLIPWADLGEYSRRIEQRFGRGLTS
jgi:hypothetical protein